MEMKPELDDIQRLSPTHWTINLVATEIPWCQKWKWGVISNCKCCASLKVWLISNELLASLIWVMLVATMQVQTIYPEW